ncbi:hypothetical protein ACG3SL_06200 [Sphingomonas sp. CJ20]
MRIARLAAGALWLALSGASDPDRPTITPVNPLTVQDDDFARHRDPAEWKGLKVSRIAFREERGDWRMWRIVNTARPRGPLWFVPHDNENAGFEAALVSVRNYGGTIIAVDSGISPGDDGVRLNNAVAYGKPIDPNRNFDSALPGYARNVLASLKGEGPIIALHTNAPGFDPTDSKCHRDDPKSTGVISIRFCDDTLIPSASQGRAWPFDDDDSVAFATFLAKGTPSDAFCRDQMVAADFNVVQERVLTSDGSLSNYAVLHGLKYLNFETQERGLDPAALAGARDRLVFMIDRALAMCAPWVKAAR